MKTTRITYKGFIGKIGWSPTEKKEIYVGGYIKKDKKYYGVVYNSELSHKEDKSNSRTYKGRTFSGGPIADFSISPDGELIAMGTMIAIKQDFYIATLISNLVSLIKLSSDSLIVSNNINSINKYKYQSNRGFIINKVKKSLVKLIISFHYSSKIIKNIIIEASHIKSIIRPMRAFDRRVRKTSRKFYINSKICI